MIATETEIAYLAGLLDGEGYISIVKHGSGHAPILNITNTDLALLLWVQMRFGGRLYRVLVGKAKDRAKDCHRLQWNKSQEARALLVAVLPYLVAKHRQAAVVMEFIDLPSQQGKSLSQETIKARGELHLSAKSLNRKGR
jgi:hypothetical protein